MVYINIIKKKSKGDFYVIFDYYKPNETWVGNKRFFLRAFLHLDRWTTPITNIDIKN